MPERFERTFQAGWGDMDFNAHMRNTAFLDRAGDVRMMYFQARGFPAAEFSRLRIGPVVRRDEIEYFREIHLLEPYTVTLALDGLAPDGSRMWLVNEFLLADGRPAARIRSAGGWLDLDARRLVAPPAPLLAALMALPRTDDFAMLAVGAPPRDPGGA